MRRSSPFLPQISTRRRLLENSDVVAGEPHCRFEQVFRRPRWWRRSTTRPSEASSPPTVCALDPFAHYLHRLQLTVRNPFFSKN
ncbi:hypothetical protein U1Q18_003559 [Sarracenia purpurea var. burkii]